MPPRSRKPTESRPGPTLPGFESLAGQGSLLPEQAMAPTDEFIVESVTELEFLDTPRRLESIMEDTRAGFLPKTHREKNAALTVLTYMGNPQFPGGIHDHLAEVHQKYIKDARKQNEARKHEFDPAKRKPHVSRAAAAIRATIAVQSILYEFADYYRDARTTRTALSILSDRITELPNQRLTLQQAIRDEFDGDTTGIAPFIQHLDIGWLMGRVDVVAFDPLLTQEQRHAPQNGKNKVVRNVYDPAIPDARRHVWAITDRLHVGDMYDDIQHAQAIEANREVLWAKALMQRYFEYQRFANKARQFAGLPVAA